MTPARTTDTLFAGARKTDFDVIVVGGGLAGGLCALALSHHAPHLRLALVEAAPEPAGNHTWCCHHDDITLANNDVRTPWEWVSRLELIRWSDYAVRFPRFTRTIKSEYLCLQSPALARALAQVACAGSAHRQTQPLNMLLGQRACTVTGETVTLESGLRLSAQLIIDARGTTTESDHAVTGRAGFQKFLGWEIELAPGHRLAQRPLLMDACVAQHDGYRFVYTLPLSRTRFLVEDTYFSRTPTLDEGTLKQRLDEYLTAQGVHDYTIVRQERGVLPMPWASLRQDVEKPSRTVPTGTEPLCVGYRGEFFHPATGYSMGQAIVVADRLGRTVGACDPLHLRSAAASTLAELRRAFSATQRFAHFLNFAVFRFAPGGWLRGLVFSPVMQLPEPILARFFAGRITNRDRIALLAATARLPWLATSSDTTAVSATGDLA